MSDVKLDQQIYNVVVKDNRWMCDLHPNQELVFHSMSFSYEYYACPKCGNYIKVD